VSFPRYPAYRDSGVEWIGAIPTDWTVGKFRHHFRESAEKIEDVVVGPMLSVSGYRGIEVKEYDDENRRRTDEELVGYRIVRKDQLVVNTMWLNYAGLGVSDHEGHVSPAYRAYSIDARYDKRFVHHLLRCELYVQGYTRLLTGIRPNSLQMSRDDLAEFPVLIPPIADQRSIAAFLDRETAKIDALVAEQRRLMDLLREQRQAVISQAVTKGLNPNTPVKDSGVEWLGEVPAHWMAVQLGRVCRKVADGPHFSPEYVDAGVPFLSARNIRVDCWSLDDAKFVSEEDAAEFDRRVIPQVGDVLYTKGGTTGVARVVDLPFRFQVWVHVAVLKLRQDAVEPAYLAFALNSVGCYEQSQLLTRGATNNDLGLTRMIRIWFALPPLEEQREIVSSLEGATSQIDALNADVQRTIDILLERRAALITAAVTGQIDVRGLALSEAA
jgi:type I restriction enzyme S subunit